MEHRSLQASRGQNLVLDRRAAGLASGSHGRSPAVGRVVLPGGGAAGLGSGIGSGGYGGQVREVHAAQARHRVPADSRIETLRAAPMIRAIISSIVALVVAQGDVIE